MSTGVILSLLLFSVLFGAAYTAGVRWWSQNVAQPSDNLDVLGHFGVAPARARARRRVM